MRNHRHKKWDCSCLEDIVRRRKGLRKYCHSCFCCQGWAWNQKVYFSLSFPRANQMQSFKKKNSHQRPYLTDFFSSRSNSIHQKSHPKWDLNDKKRWVVPLGIRLPLLLLKTHFLVSLFSSLRVRLWIYGHWRTELDIWPSIFLKWSCFTILTPVGAACAVLFHARYF